MNQMRIESKAEAEPSSKPKPYDFVPGAMKKPQKEIQVSRKMIKFKSTCTFCKAIFSAVLPPKARNNGFFPVTVWKTDRNDCTIPSMSPSI
jgi:hypothetical protein